MTEGNLHADCIISGVKALNDPIVPWTPHVNKVPVCSTFRDVTVARENLKPRSWIFSSLHVPMRLRAKVQTPLQARTKCIEVRCAFYNCREHFEVSTFRLAWATVVLACAKTRTLSVGESSWTTGFI